MRQNYFTITATIVICVGLLNISLAQEHNQQKPEQQSLPAQDQSMNVYTCPMHPEVVSNMPGKCPQCGMFLQKKKPDSDGAGRMSEMMKKPTYEQPIEGVTVQVWVIAQDEHKGMMRKMMKDEDGGMSGMNHDMMGGGLDSAKAEHQMGEMMTNQGKDPSHEMMGKEASHGMAEGESMVEGTHHVMVKIIDEKTKKAVTDISVQVLAKAASGKTSTVTLAEMMDHFGGGVNLEKGDCTLTATVKRGETLQNVQFTYRNK